MRTVEIHKFDYNDLINSLIIDAGITDKKKLEEILLFFGEKIGNTYFIINNELEIGKNSFYNAAIFLNKYFNIKNAFSIFLDLTQRIPANRTLEQAENAFNVLLHECVNKDA